MKLVYSKIPRGNFGDDLNPWLWERLLPGVLDDDPSEVLFGIGTILREKFAARLPASSRKHVFGSGAGYGPAPRLDGSWTVHFVRGPITARTLGIEPSLAITDPAILAVDLIDGIVPGAHACGFVPHHKSAESADWAAICAQAGLHYIDPHHDPEKVLRQIASCRRIVAESMHGAILADAFRVPWQAVTLGPGVLESKWQDWALSMELEYRPTVVEPTLHEPAMFPWNKRLERIGKRVAARLGHARYRKLYANDRNTGQTERAAVAATLSRLARADGFGLSADAVLSDRLSRLRAAVANFKDRR